MPQIKLVILCGLRLLVGFCLPLVVVAAEIPAAKPLVVARFEKPDVRGQIELTSGFRFIRLVLGTGLKARTC